MKLGDISAKAKQLQSFDFLYTQTRNRSNLPNFIPFALHTLSCLYKSFMSSSLSNYDFVALPLIPVYFS